MIKENVYWSEMFKRSLFINFVIVNKNLRIYYTNGKKYDSKLFPDFKNLKKGLKNTFIFTFT